nr:GNAT family N-acetyltransferase [Mycetocola tolaasinivorans]
MANLADGYVVRRAGAEDVPALLRLLADDDVAKLRGDAPDTTESADLSAYARAFARIDRDPAHLLVAVDSPAGEVVGTMQLTILPGLGRGGVNRLMIESVHVASSERGSGVGTAMIEWALAEGVRRGAALTQLTSDLRRTRAHEFYKRLGFTHSHAGFKHLG